jgi:hypothetical protein
MSNREIVIDLVRKLPPDMSLREMAREIQLVASVREGFEEPGRAEDIPLEEVDKILAEWNQPIALPKSSGARSAHRTSH